MTENYLSTSILGKQGILNSVVPNFEFRPEQQKMAEYVEHALKHDLKVIVEAGTGTGKTFAYLVPALLSKKKIIITTGTKTLQDQLFFKDLPIIQKALKSCRKIALLKGRANYLCPYRLELNLSEGRFYSPKTVTELHLVRQWSSSTQRGDIAELDALSEDASVWPHVTSTADNCLGQECPYYSKCFLNNARQKAQESDLVVVNHALFMSNLMLKEVGFGELLPDASAVIFDEAHQLPQVATNYFGTSISSRQLIELVNDIQREYFFVVKDNKDIKTSADHLEKCILDCRLALGESKRRMSWREIQSKQSLQDGITKLIDALNNTKQILKQSKSRSKGLENCYRRIKEMMTNIELFINHQTSENIYWYETYTKNFSLNMTPLDIAESFVSSMMSYDCAWIFTSATLTVKNNFKYFSNSLGLTDANTLQLPSSFDFKRQALLFIPKRLPEPNTNLYTQAVVEAVIPVLQASRGRAFFLFTSFKALYEAEALLNERLDYPLLVQGSQPRSILLDRFRELNNAILLGTSSFWEGVDVRGEALSCVIIDKLPFESPSDPILQARVKKIREENRNPFAEYQVPHAVINLKQGIGRLIRDRQDRGVLMICDPRIINRSYGSVFLNSLPTMRLTREINDVECFFSSKSNK